MKKIIFVGITNKEGKEPFDSSTKSGAILDVIIDQLDAQCEKMNYVSYAPKDQNGKLRYPTKEELNQAYSEFQANILKHNPDLLVVCGTMIFKELKQHGFDSCNILKIYHPSYIWVYKRKQLDSYIRDVCKQIKEIIF